MPRVGRLHAIHGDGWLLMLVCSIVCSGSELEETVVVLMEDQESFSHWTWLALCFLSGIGNGSRFRSATDCLGNLDTASACYAQHRKRHS
jgi:hypothetical protein